jgi:hypothetical protein
MLPGTVGFTHGYHRLVATRPFFVEESLDGFTEAMTASRAPRRRISPLPATIDRRYTSPSTPSILPVCETLGT